MHGPRESRAGVLYSRPASVKKKMGSIKTVNGGTTRIIMHQCPSRLATPNVSKLRSHTLSPDHSRDHQRLRPRPLAEDPPRCVVW